MGNMVRSREREGVLDLGCESSGFLGDYRPPDVLVCAVVVCLRSRSRCFEIEQIVNWGGPAPLGTCYRGAHERVAWPYLSALRVLHRSPVGQANSNFAGSANLGPERSERRLHLLHMKYNLSESLEGRLRSASMTLTLRKCTFKAATILLFGKETS